MDRKKLNKTIHDVLFRSGNNIDRLMTDKMDDFLLINQPPTPIKIGKCTIFIGTFNIGNEVNFFHNWSKIMAMMVAKIILMKAHNDRKNELKGQVVFELLANAVNLMGFIWKWKAVYRHLCKLLYKYVVCQQETFFDDIGNEHIKREWKNCSKSYFYKHITKEKILQMCYLIYLYNFDAEKKNLRVVVQKMGLEGLTENYIYFWLRSVPGLTGKFLALQAPSVASVFSDKTKGTKNQWADPKVKKGKA